MRALLLPGLSKGTDIALLLLRLLTGMFLVQGALHALSGGRAGNIAGAAVSHWLGTGGASGVVNLVQLLAGLLLIPGLFTRIGGLVVAIAALAAFRYAHLPSPFPGGWATLSLAGIGLMLATAGGGRYAMDDRLRGGRK